MFKYILFVFEYNVQRIQHVPWAQITCARAPRAAGRAARAERGARASSPLLSGFSAAQETLSSETGRPCRFACFSFLYFRSFYCFIIAGKGASFIRVSIVSVVSGAGWVEGERGSNAWRSFQTEVPASRASRPCSSSTPSFKTRLFLVFSLPLYIPFYPSRPHPSPRLSALMSYRMQAEPSVFGEAGC